MNSTSSFRVASRDPDSFTVDFTLVSRSNRELLCVLSVAIDLRLGDLAQRNNATIVGVSTRTDLFEPFDADSGYVEIDTLHVSNHALSFEAYLYNPDNHLKGKGSCTFFLDVCPDS